ncbi:hypothetical protein C8E03_10949 [Lachnotalea glycerini]|uniref:Uncharacterized protein n=1 Tax=Lachnotalea glycerini TaxID=1763509 RepID=A0A318EKY0_9FIRM|nr:hypothetical protein C8E03_10949 [Lachnotalea glycerini]
MPDEGVLLPLCEEGRSTLFVIEAKNGRVFLSCTND